MIALNPTEQKILSVLKNNGFEAYVVGGRVRDSLLGRNNGDIDIATNAEPWQTELAFAEYKTIETGIKHGTVTVLVDGTPAEITTYRIDSGYSDNRHPDSVKFSKNLGDDLCRRDFTINAMAYNPESGIIDMFGGADDVHNKIIRTVGDPDKRFKEDALRILRALRFASVLGFSIEPNTESALFHNKDLLAAISAERIRIELGKLLCGNDAKRIILDYTEILGVIIPEIVPMKNFDQINPHHIYNVLEHTAHVVSYTRPTIALRFAALLHDIGKVPTFTVDENGIGHFYGHDKASYKMSIDILKRLKFDNSTAGKILSLVKYHDVIIKDTPQDIKYCLNILTPPLFFELMELKRADNLSQSPRFSHKSEFDSMEKTARDIIANGDCFSLDSLEINGDDLIALGITDGREIGKLLDLMLAMVMGGRLANTHTDLTDFILSRNQPD